MDKFKYFPRSALVTIIEIVMRHQFAFVDLSAWPRQSREVPGAWEPCLRRPWNSWCV